MISFKGIGRTGAVLGAVLILSGLAIDKASAADAFPYAYGSDEVYTGQRPAPSNTTLCFSYPDTGGLRNQVNAAVSAWNKSDATVVRRNDCAKSGFAPGQIVKMAMASDGSTAWCARTPSVSSWSNRAVPRVNTSSLTMPWVRGAATTIQINSLVVRGCRETATQWLHLISHETGHWMGLGHAAGDVMSSWSYALPGPASIAKVNFLY